MRQSIRWIVVACGIIVLAACARRSTGLATAPATASGELATISATRAVDPTATGTPTASATVPSVTPTATATATPSPTPTLHPMMIAALRQLEYSGSDIVIEAELDPGVNYRRYYASYESDGLTIYALLAVPNGEPPAAGWPAIVFNHGFIPPNVYRTTERYVAYVDQLARSGYIVLRPDYRGHDQSEGEATGAYGNPGYLIDVLNAVASLKRFPEANPERIGMWGHSMGGYLTLRAMVVSRAIKAGVIWAGVVAPYPDLFARGTVTPRPTTQFEGTPSSGRRWRTQWIEEYGTPEENPEFWNGISSNSFLAEISGPVQLHHGTSDESVPLAASETLYNQMLAADQPIELYTYEGDNHNLAHFFTTAMSRSIEFFDRYLK